MDPINGLIIFLCFLLLWLAQRFTWPLWGKNGHPIGLVLFMQVLVLTLPGIIIVTFASGCLGSVTCEMVSQYTKNTVFRDYFVICFVVLLAFVFSFVIAGGRHRYSPRSITSHSFIYVCIFLTIIILFLRFFLSKNIPLFTALRGDFIEAGLQKAMILRGLDGISFPILNFYIKYFPLYTYYVCAIGYIQKKLSLRLFITVFLLTALMIIYDLQKAPLVVIVISTFWLYWNVNGKVKSILVGGLFALFVVGSLFYISYDFDGNFEYFITSVFNRLFVAQVDGMYWVYSYATYNEKYLFWGLPFASLLDVPQIDPLSDIIKIVFPAASESWVNSTSFLLGEAKAMFGSASLLVSSVVVFINVTFFCIFSHGLLVKNSELFYPAVFVMVQTIPLANNITDLIYGRFLFGSVLFMIFPLIAFFIERVIFNQCRS